MFFSFERVGQTGAAGLVEYGAVHSRIVHLSVFLGVTTHEKYGIAQLAEDLPEISESYGVGMLGRNGMITKKVYAFHILILL